jgi:type IV pilus assembly protein PilN
VEDGWSSRSVDLVTAVVREVMHIDINLASRPYEDARQFWTRWGTALGVLGLLTLVLLVLDITGFVASHHDRVVMAQTRALIADRDRTRAEADRVLNLPENRTTRDQSRYLNELIERKAFSWTRVLENLEKVMPPRVHLVSISPQLDENNELALKMTVAGDSRERAVELERRMEESLRFVQTAITAERHVDSQTGDTEQIEMAAIYVPELPNEPGTSTNPKSVTSQKPKTSGAKPSARKGTKH